MLMFSKSDKKYVHFAFIIFFLFKHYVFWCMPHFGLTSKDLKPTFVLSGLDVAVFFHAGLDESKAKQGEWQCQCETYDLCVWWWWPILGVFELWKREQPVDRHRHPITVRGTEENSTNHNHKTEQTRRYTVLPHQKYFPSMKFAQENCRKLHSSNCLAFQIKTVVHLFI